MVRLIDEESRNAEEFTPVVLTRGFVVVPVGAAVPVVEVVVVPPPPLPVLSPMDASTSFNLMAFIRATQLT